MDQQPLEVNAWAEAQVLGTPARPEALLNNDVWGKINDMMQTEDELLDRRAVTRIDIVPITDTYTCFKNIIKLYQRKLHETHATVLTSENLVNDPMFLDLAGYPRVPLICQWILWLVKVTFPSTDFDVESMAYWNEGVQGLCLSFVALYARYLCQWISSMKNLISCSWGRVRIQGGRGTWSVDTWRRVVRNEFAKWAKDFENAAWLIVNQGNFRYWSPPKKGAVIGLWDTMFTFRLRRYDIKQDVNEKGEPVLKQMQMSPVTHNYLVAKYSDRRSPKRQWTRFGGAVAGNWFVLPIPRDLNEDFIQAEDQD